MDAEIVIHYCKSDKKFLSDYCSVQVKFNGKVVKEYSDDYHDKGLEKAEAFVDGVASVFSPVTVVRTQVADCVCD